MPLETAFHQLFCLKFSFKLVTLRTDGAAHGNHKVQIGTL